MEWSLGSAGSFAALALSAGLAVASVGLASAGLASAGPAATARGAAAATEQEDGAAANELPLVRVTADDTRVERSCRLLFPDEPIVDANGDGVVHVVGNDLVVRCEGRLRGSAASAAPDTYTGTGIVVRGQRNELAGARVSGFRVGIHVDGAFATHVVDADVSDNHRQRLGSTWEREDGSDWLFPHRGDEGAWAREHGAGLLVSDARGTDVVRLLARDVQNGIVLDRASNGAVIGCDASFLSGWGLAMWRSSDNAIVGNRFDFCVRGYAHGRYNRGQDSAGVLLFEQCRRNTFRANSATHGGDGVFGFAGREALGEGGAAPDGFDHRRAGCNENVFESNDLSFAAAHGLELTFSFDTLVRGNLFEENAICGVWFGYGRDAQFSLDRFVRNGTSGYGAERGGINAEHGQRLSVNACSFEDNAVDVRFWTDEDPGLAATPWVRANGRGARDNFVVGNHHEGEGPWVEIDGAERTVTDAEGEDLVADEASLATIRRLVGDPGPATVAKAITRELLAQIRAEALGARGVEPLAASLVPRPRGRDRIVVGAWGPYDWSRPYLQPLERGPALHRYRVLGPEGTALGAIEWLEGGEDIEATVERRGAAPIGPDGLASAVITVRPKRAGEPVHYRFAADVGGTAHVGEGALLPVAWDLRLVAWEQDPREDEAHLLARLDEAEDLRVDELRLDFGGGTPGDALRALGVAQVPDSVAAIGAERFGTRARAQVALPAGRWRVVTLSDDGLRVRVDDDVVIDDWTWHAPKEHTAEFTLSEARTVAIEVLHFELDGHAVLHLALEPVD